MIRKTVEKEAKKSTKKVIKKSVEISRKSVSYIFFVKISVIIFEKIIKLVKF